MRVPGISRDLDIGDPIYTGSNFDWGEATKDGRRIPANESITQNIIKLARELDKVRELLGKKPIIITSWYRDPRSNRIVGGATDSRHLRGDAADVQIKGMTPKSVQLALESYWTGGMGYGDTFTHLDLRGYRARWDY